jgi:hypothetical protein
MPTNCVIIDSFNTSLGNVVFLGFKGKKRPHLDMILKNQTDFRWQIGGIGANRKLDSAY